MKGARLARPQDHSHHRLRFDGVFTNKVYE